MTTPPMTGPGAPSGRRLLRSTLIAAAVAAALLVTVVLPAEYGVDVTGIGRVLGLTQMGETKRQLAAEAEADARADSVATAMPATAPAAAGVPAPAPAGRADTIVVTLAPAQAAEFKLVMRKDATARFVWTTDRGVVNYDTHGDAPGIRYHPYAKGTGVRADSGSLTAAFEGQHGWFWRNRGTDTVTVTLRTHGDYSDVKRVQ